MSCIVNQKEMFENVYGISCVENQVLAILKGCSVDISCLYNNCAIPLKEMFYFFVTKGDNPYEFNRIPKIQDELKKYGIITLEIARETSSQDIIKELKQNNDNEFVLIQVNPEFTKRTLYSRGFRNDHFVRVVIDNDCVIIFNDIPCISVSLNQRELADIYSGICINISLKKTIDKAFANFMWGKRIYKPENYTPFYFSFDDIKEVEKIDEKLRNMFSIYRIMCDRIWNYYGSFVKKAPLLKLSAVVTRSFAKLEYLRIKEKLTLNNLFKILCEVNYQEIETMNYLKQEIKLKMNEK